MEIFCGPLCKVGPFQNLPSLCYWHFEENNQDSPCIFSLFFFTPSPVTFTHKFRSWYTIEPYSKVINLIIITFMLQNIRLWKNMCKHLEYLRCLHVLVTYWFVKPYSDTKMHYLIFSSKVNSSCIAFCHTCLAQEHVQVWTSYELMQWVV